MERRLQHTYANVPKRGVISFVCLLPHGLNVIDAKNNTTADNIKGNIQTASAGTKTADLGAKLAAVVAADRIVAAESRPLAGSNETARFITVRMPVNPETFSQQFSRMISPMETRGGYVYQYFGEQPIDIALAGTTGSSGIVGISVLEQAYLLQARPTGDFLVLRKDASSSPLTNIYTNSAIKGLWGSLWVGGPVMMLFRGWSFLCHFTRFNFTEDAEQPGLWRYDMALKAINRKGTRINM